MFYDENFYKGSAETTFKKQYSNQKKSFNLETNTELSKEIWPLKSSNYIYEINWKILKNRAKIIFYLCLNEKLEILSYKGKNLLNKRSEIANGI